MMTRTSRSLQRGFNLIEVMAAVLVVALGLLGLAKVEAMAVSDAATSGSRSVAALQVQSLAAAMHANPGYWQTSSANGSCAISGTTICSALNGSYVSCVQSICSATQMAAYDVQTWANSLNNLLPGVTGSINCSIAENNTGTTSGSSEYSCIISLNWSEKTVALNRAVGIAQATANSMTANYSTTVWP